jgi:signal transduction histidine kinase
MNFNGILQERMWAKIDKRIERCPKWVLRACCILTMLLLVVLQKGIGRTTLSPLFAVPISMLAWYDGAESAFALSLVTILGGIAVSVTGYDQSIAVQAFGTFSRIIFFGFLSLALPRLHYLQNNLEELADERGKALANEVAARRTIERELLDAAERKQRGIGQDTHDGLSQHLVATAMVSYAHAQRLTVIGSAEAERAARIVDLVQQSNALVRSISKGLHPIEMGGDALMYALEDFAITTSRLFSIQCQLDCPLPVVVDDPSMAMQLFRIAQEGVSNAVRHGHATEVTISFSESDCGISLRVSDNGIGMPSSSTLKNGLGLYIMAARANFIGGKVSLGSRLSGGTELVCQVPGL